MQGANDDVIKTLCHTSAQQILIKKFKVKLIDDVINIPFDHKVTESVKVNEPMYDI